MYCLQIAVFVNFFLRSCKEEKKVFLPFEKLPAERIQGRINSVHHQKNVTKQKIYNFLRLRDSKGQSDTLSGGRHLELCLLCERRGRLAQIFTHHLWSLHSVVSRHATLVLFFKHTEKVVMWKQSKHSDAHQLSGQNTELKNPQTFDAVVRFVYLNVTRASGI